VYKLQIYQIAESNRIEKNRFGSENRIESKLFCPNWNALLPGVSRGVVFVILRLAVLVEHRLVTDRHRQTQTQTDTGPWLVPRMHSIAL